MRSVGVLSLGCKVNTYESEFIINKLQENGYTIKPFTDICDVYIINTCTVTNTSDIKSRKMIRKAIRMNSEACIVAMGCFIEANKDLNLEGIDIYIGNRDKSKITEILENWFQTKKTIKRLYTEEVQDFEDMYITNFPGRTRAFVKIQDGCENYCSYCIIPYVRGKCRSKEKTKVLKEIESLVTNGYKEIVLTGIHTGNYGVDLDTNFAELLREIIIIPGLKRLRISSIEVTELTSEVLAVIRDSKVIVDHLHIPLQSGSNEILFAMNRKYQLNEFEEKIEELRKIRPNISISTDVIVGFPGESEELFLETIETCKRIAFSKIHVFPYSERQGTKASLLPNSVPINLRKKRARTLLEVSNSLERTYMSKFLTTEVEVLIEENKDNCSLGHTSNFLHVKIKGLLPQNKIVKIKITKIDYPYCLGEIT